MHVNFQFKDYITKLLGADPGKLQKVSSNPEAQCPDLAAVEELHNSFKRWEQQPGVCSLMAVCIAAAACKAGTSWPLGHLLLLPDGEEVYACHVGAEKPKLLFLMDCKLCLHIRVYLYIFPLWRRCFPSGFHQSLRPLASAYRDLAGGFLDVFGLVACFCQCFHDV